MWSQTVGGGPRTSSRSTTPRRLRQRRRDHEQPGPASARTTTDLAAEFWAPGPRHSATATRIWPTEEQVLAYIAARAGSDAGGDQQARALCIGIDEYPSQADQLAWMRADAQAWKLELEHAGFAVEIIENGDATRQHIVERIQDLIVNSTRRRRAGRAVLRPRHHHRGPRRRRPGGGREDGGVGRRGICPVDFRDGELLIDDDLGELWDLLPDGVNLTVFFDSCHSGGNQRAVWMPTPDMATRKARLVRMTAANVKAYKAKRGTQPPATASRDRERSVYFGACQAGEVAFESNGQGDFTRRALRGSASS